MDDSDWGLLEPLSAPPALTSDDAVLAALLRVEQQLSAAWSAVAGDVEPDADVFDSAGLDRRALQAGVRADGVVVPELVRQLRERAGEDTQSVHRGATSQDIVDTAMMVVARDVIAAARAELMTAGHALSALAERHRATVTMAITLGQAAAPSTYGVTLAGWLDGVVSAVDRLDAISMPAQLGGAVGTAEAFVVAAVTDAPERVRAEFASRLGLADPGRSWHTERSAVLGVAAAGAAVCAAAGRIGRELSLLSRSGVDEVTLASAGGSSAMPHKRNPIDAVLLVGAGIQAPGLLATVHQSAISADSRPSGEWHAEWAALRGLLRLTGGASSGLAAALGGLAIDTEAIERNYRRAAADIPGATVTAATRERSDRIVDAARERFAHLSEVQP
ncbi:MAG: lyase family protein [Pseudolysinimonas sp.]